MKLGYLVPEFPSQTHAFFWREVQALRAQGVTVHLVSTRQPEQGASSHAFAEEARAQTYYLFPPHWGRVLAVLLTHPLGVLRVLAYVFGLRQTPWKQRAMVLGLLLPAADLLGFAREKGLDHLHVHSCANAAHVAALSERLGGLPYSLTVHGDLPVYGVDHAAKMKHARFVACVTRPLQQQVMADAGVPTVRAPVHWMGVDVGTFLASHGRRGEANQLHVLTVARLNHMKGHVYALEAVRRLADQGIDVRYSIAGAGPAQAEIEQHIARLNLGDRVQMLGTQGEAQVLALLQQVDVFLLSSIGAGEAAPVSVMEAMACGVPVVCSIIGGTPDMIVDGENGYLVPQKDVDAIALRLSSLAGDPVLRQRIGAAARVQAENLFDCAPLATRLRQLITSSQ